MSLQGILEVEISYVWGLNFMGSFPPSFGNPCILVVVDYFSKWIKAMAFPTNNAKIVTKFIHKNIIRCS